MPLLDFAYQGFADGIREDAAGLHMLLRHAPEMLIASSFSKNFGLYRERDELIPIVLRSDEGVRETAALDLQRLQVLPSMSTNALPLAQVVDGGEVSWRDNIIWRWDRKRAITVQSSVRNGTAPVLMSDVRARFEAIPLPHPSGASPWPRTEPGKTLLRAALGRIRHHQAMQRLLSTL